MKQDWQHTSFLFIANAAFIEELYRKYLSNPYSVDISWAQFFQQQAEAKSTEDIAKDTRADSGSMMYIADQAKDTRNGTTDEIAEIFTKKMIIYTLQAECMINAYREHGHHLAKLDPLELEITQTHKSLQLDLEHFGFTNKDLTEQIYSSTVPGLTRCTLSAMRAMLEQTYASSVGVEFAHIEDIAEKNWLYRQWEEMSTTHVLDEMVQKTILQDLVEIEGFEQYLHIKFPGAKRFSVQGSDTSVLCLKIALTEIAKIGVTECMLGLAHRGRLTILAQVAGKPYRAIFAEFMGKSSFSDDDSMTITGDVKYHMGFSSERTMATGNKMHITLLPNPSHLEAIDAVVAGKVRAKQDYLGRDRKQVMGILVHGDTAFCGQGVVAETLIMSGLEPYRVGGILHVVINNQIGFTANTCNARVGRYCTDIAKAAGMPIIHVNGEDIEKVALVTKLACAYRNKFAKDIVIDIIGYRKYGHNEGDEPMYTQPLMYERIKNKQTIASIYAEKLLSTSGITNDEYTILKQNFKTMLDDELACAKDYYPQGQQPDRLWRRINNKSEVKVSTATGVKVAILKGLVRTISNVPSTFAINNKLKKLFAARIHSADKNEPVDWATAEQMAFATILQAKIPIRFTGQDVRRGTFSHRHAVLWSQVDNTMYVPLNHVVGGQALFEINDSNLSEYAALGFEYGYSLVNPDNLVIWEAQFGDFCNGAQIIFDQFISSAAAKWGTMSGLVCLLPHGMEGQGPEHSSARLERFLQLCAEDNIQVVYPSTPASMFHLLRRQVLCDWRKPLIVMSPKSLLRHRLAVSHWSEFDENTIFKEVIDEIDDEVKVSSAIKRVIFCTGKVYYDLLEVRRKLAIRDIIIIRLEQIYPFVEELIVHTLKDYVQAQDFVWCQEEPENMGAWAFIQPRLNLALSKVNISKSLKLIGRPEQASPAVGSVHMHNKQQEALISNALLLSTSNILEEIKQ